MKYDDRLEHLADLCIGCYGAQPLHAHLLQHPDYVEFERGKARA